MAAHDPLQAKGNWMKTHLRETLQTHFALPTVLGLLLTVLLILLTITAPTVHAEGEAVSIHEHNLLSEEKSLSLSQVLEETLARFPSTIELHAQAAEAQAWRSRGRHWLADSPALTFRYQSDRWGDHNRLDEYEAGLELPLWRWGERTATQSLGNSMTDTSDAHITALRWEVAGQLRHALWAMAAAQNRLVQAGTELEHSSQLTKSVRRRHELGDVPESDLLLARNALLEAQTRHINAEASMLDAERTYRNLTTLRQRPAFVTEPLSPLKNIDANHPALVLANARLERAQAKLRLTEKSAKGSPRLLIGPRRERASFSDEFENSIGMTLTVPFGGATHARTETTSIAREVAAAQAARDRTARTLDLQLHEAAHGLSLAEENLTLATQRKELATRRYKMARRAHELGEIELLDLLKLQNVAQGAEREATQLLIDKKYQTALYNQAVGALP